MKHETVSINKGTQASVRSYQLSSPHLVIPGASGVKLSSDRTDELRQASFICCVDVLISLLDDEGPSSPFSMHLRTRLRVSSIIVMPERKRENILTVIFFLLLIRLKKFTLERPSTSTDASS